ncbi:MAG: DNA methyltransferase, partial [Kiritimatiellae bacterium]|nr:DNA methyltransferase [Kiritimatiellia bacterium]
MHPYFTRRSANVVREYIGRYSREGDTILDPFGGSGVTAIEAFLMGRHGIQNDLNPFANFISASIADTRLADTVPLERAFEDLAAKCRDKLLWLEAASEDETLRFLAAQQLPENIALPRTSDAKHFHDLCTTRQLAGLSFLKSAILEVADESVRWPLLLSWSAAASKLNRTFISSKGRAESRGGSSIFSIYRYKLAKTPVELPIWETFLGRYRNVLAAKREIFAIRDAYRRSHDNASQMDSTTHFRAISADAADLKSQVSDESIDYVFTDPPYGAFIAYLDLSTLWNHWLGFSLPPHVRDEEIIVGGERSIPEEQYKRRLAASMCECVRVLKRDRWLSIVFQHWDISYFETILQAVTGSGAKLM